MSSPYQMRPPNQDGIVLISVLWIVAVLSLLVTTFSASVRTAVAINRTERSIAQVEAISDAGIELAIAGLRLPKDAKWKADGRLYKTRFAGARLTLQIFDANGFLDINYATNETLLAVLEGATGSKGLARALNDFIIQRREAFAGQDRTSSDTDNADPDAPTLHKPVAFHDISELRAVPGMTRSMMARLNRILTVHSGGKGVNPATAPVELLRLLPDLSGQQVSQIVEARKTATSKTAIASVVSSSEDKFTADEGPAYKIAVAVTGKGFAKPINAAATILLNSDPRRPYFGLSWRPVGD